MLVTLKIEVKLSHLFREGLRTNSPVADKLNRSALTLGEATHEITKNRGSLYDPDAVDACKRLFVEGRFAFKN